MRLSRAARRSDARPARPQPLRRLHEARARRRW
ncbi:phage DNA packaging protein J [Mycolicibacterium hippocampi]